MVPKTGHVTITKIENVACSHVEKFTDSKNAILLDLRRKITEVIAEKLFPNSGVTRRLWTLGRLELTLVVNTWF